LSAATIIQEASADGVTLTLTPSGAIRAVGAKAAVARWAAPIREHKLGIVEVLSAAANDPGDLDIFAPELAADPHVHQRWVVTIPGRDPFGVIVFPDANQAQMRAQYSTATSIRPAAEEQDSESTEGKHT
jgi:hypothetical protein